MFTIAIVGNTNTGKTSLFNFLTNTNFSLVSSKEYYTLDFNYGLLKFNKNNIILIDTCSIKNLNIFRKKNDLKKYLNIRKYIFIIKNVNLIFFLVDSRLITDRDLFFLKILLNINNNIVLILNKIDLYKNFIFDKEKFNYLGIDKIYPISILNRSNIYLLFDNLFKNKNLFKNNNFFVKRLLKSCINLYNYKYLFFKDNIFIKILILGKPNVGKSFLLNLLVGNNRSVVSNLKFSTKDFISFLIKFKNICYSISDSPAIYKINKYKYLNKNIFLLIKNFFNIILYVIDINDNVSRYDLKILNLLFNRGKLIILVFNKCILKKYYYNIHKKNLIKRYDFMKYMDIFYIKDFNNINNILSFRKKIFNIILSNYKNIFLKKINNNLLTKILKLFFRNNIINNYSFKLKYSCISKYYPLVIIIYGNKINLINSSNKKHLLNFYMEKLNLKGCKIFLKFKEIYNPFFKKK